MKFRGFITASILLALPATAQQSGVLLGLSGTSCHEDKCTKVMRTLWIAPQNGSVKLLATLNDLVVPRQDGFWRVGVRTYCRQPGDWSISSIDVLSAAPISEPLTRPQGEFTSCKQAEVIAEKNYKQLLAKAKVARSEYGVEARNAELHGAAHVCETSGIDIEFLNPEYVAISSGYGVDCGVHPDGAIHYQVSRLGERTQTPLALSSLGGDKAKTTYQDLAKRALVDNANGAEGGQETYRMDQDLKQLAEANSGCFPEFNDSDWFVSHEGGRWTAKGGINTHRLCGVAVEFDLPSDMMALLRIHETPALEFAAVQRQVPEALDAYWSPRGDLVVVPTRAGSLLVFEPKQLQLGSPVLTLPFEPDKVVMAEWALGRNVTRWTNTLTSLKTPR